MKITIPLLATAFAIVAGFHALALWVPAFVNWMFTP